MIFLSIKHYHLKIVLSSSESNLTFLPNVILLYVSISKQVIMYTALYIDLKVPSDLQTAVLSLNSDKSSFIIYIGPDIVHHIRNLLNSCTHWCILLLIETINSTYIYSSNHTDSRWPAVVPPGKFINPAPCRLCYIYLFWKQQVRG